MILKLFYTPTVIDYTIIHQKDTNMQNSIVTRWLRGLGSADKRMASGGARRPNAGCAPTPTSGQGRSSRASRSALRVRSFPSQGSYPASLLTSSTLGAVPRPKDRRTNIVTYRASIAAKINYPYLNHKIPTL